MKNTDRTLPTSGTNEVPPGSTLPLLVLTRTLKLVVLDTRQSSVQLGFMPDVSGLRGRELRRQLRDLGSIRQRKAYWTYLYQRLMLVVPCRVNEEIVIPNLARLRIAEASPGGPTTIEMTRDRAEGLEIVTTAVIEPVPLPASWIHTVNPGTFKTRREPSYNLGEPDMSLPWPAHSVSEG